MRVAARTALPVAALLVVLALTGCGRIAHRVDQGITPAPSATSASAPAGSAPGLDQDSADLDAVDGALKQAGGDLGEADRAAGTGDQP